MNSLGIFHDVKLKNYNNVLSSLKRACDQTSNLVDYMDNYKNSSNINRNYKSINLNINQIKRRNQSVIGKMGRNIILNNNSNKFKRKNGEYNNKIKINKYKNLKNKIFGNDIKVNNNINHYKIINNEPYNYNKEYENNLIDEIENLFHHNYNNNKKESQNKNGIKNAKDIMPNNYMDIYSLMENEFNLVERQIEQNINKNYKQIY